MSTFDEDSEAASRRLWCAVILNAIDDAKSTATSARTQDDARKARVWLTVPSRDFDEVCYLAGLDPNAVRQRARVMFPAIDLPGVGDNFPERLGTGGGCLPQVTS